MQRTTARKPLLPFFPLASVCLVLLSGLLSPGLSSAEEPAGQAPASAQEPDAKERLAELERRQEQLRAELEAMRQSSVAQSEELDKVNAELEAVREEMEMVSSSTAEELAALKRFRIYGFFDVTLSKYFIDKGSLVNLVVAGDNLSFFLTNLNIYLQNHLTETLDTLVELHFSFLPHGTYEAFDVNLNGQQLPDMEYKRRNTNVIDPFTYRQTTAGSVTIERAHLTWRPFSWLNVLAGRYLTPYGIYNTDHGSTVVFMIHEPFLITNQFVPSAQTGAQVFGRAAMRPGLFFDYAVTVSNGRGPTETVYDLDNNKGLGLRLSLLYDSRQVMIKLGGYGYYGKYTDTKKVVELSTDNNGNTLEPSVSVKKTEGYDDIVIAGDFQFAIFGLKLMAEGAWRRKDYEKSPPLNPTAIITHAREMNVSGAQFEASNIGYDYYFALLYTLPLDRWLGQVRLSPYVTFEHTFKEDTLDGTEFYFSVAGLNANLSPYVVLKLEGLMFLNPYVLKGGLVKSLAAQLAVSF